MTFNSNLKCDFNCSDVDKNLFIPSPDIDPQSIKMIMISESPPKRDGDYFYDKGEPDFLATTNEVFAAAGFAMRSIDDYLNRGIYLTTAIKCRKLDYLVSSATLKNCSLLLRRELEQFPNFKVVMLMGDFAIKCVNAIWKAKSGKAVIPSGSTYKIRGGVFESEGIRFFPSYSQTGDNIRIEKSKKVMVAEDIRKAMQLI